MTVNDTTSASLLMETASAGARAKTDTPKDAEGAAQQFEALLIGQMLRSVRESSKGWLGTGEDASSSCATEYAEQQFAAALAERGGLGMAHLIAAGLAKK
jgi:Rod binding domain-containing protein